MCVLQVGEALLIDEFDYQTLEYTHDAGRMRGPDGKGGITKIDVMGVQDPKRG